MQFDDLTLGWLAGILEGEGSFMKGTPSKPNLPIIAMSSTDEDVIVKISKLLNIGYNKARSKYYDTHPNWKQAYQFRVIGSKAIELMHILKPFMSYRRQSQIDTALASHNPTLSKRKLTDIQVQEIRKRMLTRETVVSIAESMKISPWAIYDIRNKGNYKSIT